MSNSLRVRLPTVYAGELIEPTLIQVFDASGSPIDLTDSTISCALQVGLGPKVTRAGAVVDPENGVLSVTWTEDDFLVAGRVRGVITYTADDGERVAADLRGRVPHPSHPADDRVGGGDRGEGR